MNSEKNNLLKAELKLLQDKDLKSPSNSLLQKYSSTLVKDEQIRRLKLRLDLSVEVRKDMYSKIISDSRRRELSEDFNQFFRIHNDAQAFNNEKVTLLHERIRAQSAEQAENHKQLAAIHRNKGDPFEGKTKPGDWRPDGTENCPACNGSGKGTEGRICSKCGGRGFICK